RDPSHFHRAVHRNVQSPRRLRCTTGAGDQFAAGFLYGLATGQPLDVAGRMGCIAAAEVIGHYGARPDENVMDLFKKAGLV
ncbi:MAG: PfkB family carbohydrate kinase, partial [Pseudomonadota bacterium]